ncbi:hypothetical protein CRUP_030496 [Coryphaenoides rupestris]|nr:hypothetical protein CRUP_030496 [Coryphaenoides rupestris]
MSKDSRHDGRRRSAGQHRIGPRVSQGGGDGRDRSGSNSSGSSHGGGKSKNTPIIALKASFQRSNSHDKVRKIVAEEGRAARNLIAWSVPLESKEEEAKSKNNSSGNSRALRINSGLNRNKKQNAGVEGKVPPGILLDKVAEKSPTKARQPRKVDLRARAPTTTITTTTITTTPTSLRTVVGMMVWPCLPHAGCCVFPPSFSSSSSSSSSSSTIKHGVV